MKNLNSLCEYLPWDSHLFDIRIARIKKCFLNNREIKQCIRWCRENKITCVYYLVDPARVNSIHLAESSGFHLVDIRVTLETDILASPYINMPLKETMPLVREANRNDIVEIKKIAKENHFDTRFFKDKRFPRDKSAELYELWIEKGFKNVHGIVLVAKIKKKTAGYIVLDISENHTGKIELVGVNNKFRDRGIGGALVCAALRWFNINGAKRATVVTQGTNISALRLYSKWGFLPHETQCWYHLWCLPSEKK